MGISSPRAGTRPSLPNSSVDGARTCCPSPRRRTQDVVRPRVGTDRQKRIKRAGDCSLTTGWTRWSRTRPVVTESPPLGVRRGRRVVVGTPWSRKRGGDRISSGTPSLQSHERLRVMDQPIRLGSSGLPARSAADRRRGSGRSNRRGVDGEAGVVSSRSDPANLDDHGHIPLRRCRRSAKPHDPGARSGFRNGRGTAHKLPRRSCRMGDICITVASDPQAWYASAWTTVSRRVTASMTISVGLNGALGVVKLVCGIAGSRLLSSPTPSNRWATSLAPRSCVERVDDRLRPADANHPYGHGKAEPLAALLVNPHARGRRRSQLRPFTKSTPHHTRPRRTRCSFCSVWLW